MVIPASSSFSLRDPTFSSAPSFSLHNFRPPPNNSQQLTADGVVATYEASTLSKGVGVYHSGEGHPMKPHRLTLNNHLVISYGLHQRIDVYEPRVATKEELEMFHDEDYVDFLARITPDNIRHFTSLVSWTTGVAINWTGGLHQAEKSEASGFCYVNDVVLAILELLRVDARVRYVDINLNHGGDVQEASSNLNRALAVSFHKYSPNFPVTGHIDELGHTLGKYFSLNSIMGPTIDTFRPSAIVLQCGTDSFGNDRTGCFSIAAHGECVRFIKSFDLPLVVLGGGGYTIKNVSRCWTYGTAVLLGLMQDLPNALSPHTAYDDFFAPDWKLHPEVVGGRNRLENLDSRKQLERIRVDVLELLRHMAGASGLQMSEVPPSLAS
ncbi:hypothetical protein JCM8097_008585 [Rhodosporidiobolus ruineniae]